MPGTIAIRRIFVFLIFGALTRAPRTWAANTVASERSAAASNAILIGPLETGIDPSLNFSQNVRTRNFDERLGGTLEVPSALPLPQEVQARTLTVDPPASALPAAFQETVLSQPRTEARSIQQPVSPVLTNLALAQNLALLVLSPSAPAGSSLTTLHGRASSMFEASTHFIYAPASDALPHSAHTPVFPLPFAAPSLEDRLRGSFPRAEIRKFIGILEQLPEAARNQPIWKALVLSENKARNEVDAVMSLRGLGFELSREAIIRRQGLEELSPQESQGLSVDYIGLKNYRRDGKTDFSAANHEYKKSEIQNDIPVARRGEPYVYETKSFLQTSWGTRPGHWNQLLKYEAAIRAKKIAGASVEVHGRIHRSLLDWAMRPNAENPIPDIEIIYAMRLPSDAEYRFVLKPAASSGLRFFNDPAGYTDQDRTIIRAVYHALTEGSMKEILASNYIPKDEASPKLGPLLDYPINIRTNRLFREYERLWWKNLYRRLLDAEK